MAEGEIKKRRRKIKQKPSLETIPEPFMEKSPEPPCLEPSVPHPQQAAQNTTISALLAAIKIEDKRYEDINFDVPPTVWSKSDKNKMRSIMRELSITYKKQADKYRTAELQKKYRNSGIIEKTLAREIVGLLQKDYNLTKFMELSDVAFSTFTRREYDWNTVSRLLDNKYSPAECKEYWFMDLYPRLKNMGFSEENDKNLIQLAIENQFRNWDKISDRILGHTEYQCYVHFRRNLFKEILHKAQNEGNIKEV